MDLLLAWGLGVSRGLPQVTVPPNDGTTYSGTVQKDVEASVEHESATGQVVVKPCDLFGDLLVTGE